MLASVLTTPPSTPAWWRPLRCGLHLAALVAELAGACGRPSRARAGRRGAAQVTIRSGLTLLEVGGDAAAIGTHAGELLARPTRRLLALMRHAPPMLAGTLTGRASSLSRMIPPAYQAETHAWAQAAGCDGEVLLRVNVVADACCTALVAAATPDRPLTVGRNLDFFPAGALGRGTVIQLTRRSGVHPVVSIGWAGFTGVLSGINRPGLSACVLLNLASPGHGAGIPVAYVVRGLLEDCTTVEQAIQRFSRDRVASSHYVVVADPDQAAVIWQVDGVTQRQDLRSGWLTCSNGRRNAAGQADDDRGRYLLDLATRSPAADAAWMRSALTGSLLPGINAQAMLLEPATRTLQLALGSGTRPAARAPWHQLELGPALAGAPLGACHVTTLGRPRQRRSYAARS